MTQKANGGPKSELKSHGNDFLLQTSQDLIESQNDAESCKRKEQQSFKHVHSPAAEDSEEVAG